MTKNQLNGSRLLYITCFQIRTNALEKTEPGHFTTPTSTSRSSPVREAEHRSMIPSMDELTLLK